jgi:phosphate:Na+ symporter
MTARSLLILAFPVLAYGFWVSTSFTDLAAGVALFLFGIFCMEQGFKTYQGGTLQSMLNASTDSLGKSLAFGLASSALTQSSSLVSVLTISFLSAELIGLRQGIGIILGANLGTTTGAWLIAGFGLNLQLATYALPMLVFGALLLLQGAKKLNGAGWVLIGLSFLFLGIDYLKDGFATLSGQIDLSRYALTGLRGLLTYTFIGIAATVLMQSSHATLTLIITALAAGQINYENALALAVGANVGTTVTAVVAALGANIAGKRLAAAHLVFNVATGVVALLLMQFLVVAVDTLADWIGIPAENHSLKLALFHTLFNLLGIALILPVTDPLARWLERLLQRDPKLRDQPRYLSTVTLDLPGAAVAVVNKETRHLFSNAFTLIAHGLNLHRSWITGTSDLERLLTDPGPLIEFDIDEYYTRKIKDIYSANIEFISRAQAAATPEFAGAFNALRQANMDVVGAIKAVKHLRKNLSLYMHSENPDIRREYNRFRIRLGEVLRAVAAVRDTEDSAVALLSLDMIRTDILGGQHDAATVADALIRERKITSRMATSLINDGVYAREVI